MDRYSMDRIVAYGIIPAIQVAIENEETTDMKVTVIGNLINTYNEYFHTGRSVDVSKRCEEQQGGKA